MGTCGWKVWGFGAPHPPHTCTPTPSHVVRTRTTRCHAHPPPDSSPPPPLPYRHQEHYRHPPPRLRHRCRPCHCRCCGQRPPPWPPSQCRPWRCCFRHEQASHRRSTRPTAPPAATTTHAWHRPGPGIASPLGPAAPISHAIHQWPGRRCSRQHPAASHRPLPLDVHLSPAPAGGRGSSPPRPCLLTPPAAQPPQATARPCQHPAGPIAQARQRCCCCRRRPGWGRARVPPGGARRACPWPTGP